MDTLRVKTESSADQGTDGRYGLRAAAALLVLTAVFAFAWWHLQKKHAVPAGTAAVLGGASAPTDAQQRVLLVEDPVTHRPVDPNNAPAVLEFGDKKIYFDSLESLNAFKDNPARYARVRIRVQVSQGSGASAPPVASSQTQDLPPGDPPEPPSGNAPVPSASGPVGDAPLTQAPAAPPDSGPQPSPSVEADAPSVTESDNGGPPSDVPEKVPASAPDLGADGPSVTEPGPGGAPAHAKRPPSPRKRRKSAGDGLPVLPPTVGGDGMPPNIQSPTSPDANGFSIPPGLGDGPPARKRPSQRPKKARAASTDAPPSVDETGP